MDELSSNSTSTSIKNNGAVHHNDWIHNQIVLLCENGIDRNIDEDVKEIIEKSMIPSESKEIEQNQCDNTANRYDQLFVKIDKSVKNDDPANAGRGEPILMCKSLTNSSFNYSSNERGKFAVDYIFCMSAKILIKIERNIIIDFMVPSMAVQLQMQ